MREPAEERRTTSDKVSRRVSHVTHVILLWKNMMDINVGLLQRLMIFLKKKSIVSNTSRGAVTGNCWETLDARDKSGV